MRRIPGLVFLVGAVLLICGCPAENYPDLVPATLSDIDRIRKDTGLSAQEKRLRLTALDIDPETINALLRTERTGNQYGGDLRTAYTKVTAPNFAALTPDEVQIYGDEAGKVDSTLNVSLTDAEAQAVVTFFNDSDISSPEALQAFLSDPANTLPEKIPDDVLRPLFIDFDPTRLLANLP